MGNALAVGRGAALGDAAVFDLLVVEESWPEWHADLLLSYNTYRLGCGMGKEKLTMRIAERIGEIVRQPGRHRPIVIGFLGDSVTQGCFELYKTGEDSFETEFRSSQAYHGKLKQVLELVFPSVPVNIINGGISGDNAPNGRRRLDRDILSFQPDLVVVCFGLNDVNFGLEKLGVYEEALEGIFCDLKAAGVETIFLTPNMMGTRVSEEERDPMLRAVLADITKRQMDGTMDAYMERARQVCARNQVPVCDCYAKWKSLERCGADVTRLLANRVNHPIEQMHWLFAFTLFEMITNSL